MMKILMKYFSNVIAEFGKIKYPTKTEIISASLSTLMIVVCSSLLFYFIDVLVRFVLKFFIVM